MYCAFRLSSRRLSCWREQNQSEVSRPEIVCDGQAPLVPLPAKEPAEEIAAAVVRFTTQDFPLLDARLRFQARPDGAALLSGGHDIFRRGLGS